MAWMLIDSHMFRSDDLSDWLESSTSNKAVIMDLQSMEMHKKIARLTARKSTAITSRYPRQVLVLRSTRDFYTWHLNSRRKVRRLVSEKETRGFAAYGTAHQRGAETRFLEEKTAELETIHRRNWEKLVQDSAHIPRTFKSYVDELSVEERSMIRTGTAYSPDLQRKLLRLARDIALDLFTVVGDPERHRPNHKVDLKHTLVFRYGLCIMLHYTRWVALGQNMALTAEQAANDVVDLHLASLGTFFAGVRSNDRNLQQVHLLARHMLRSSGAYVG